MSLSSGLPQRRQKSESVAYILLYRTQNGRSRWHTIGRHGSPWTPETAREEAKRLLGEVAVGGDPARNKKTARHASTVAEVCDLYLADAEAGKLLTRRQLPKKNSTLATDRGRIQRHIKPLLGALSVGAVTPEDVDDFLHAVADGRTAAKIKTKPRGIANVRGGRGTASRTVGLLGAIFTYAVRHRRRANNPVHGITRFPDGRRERRLDENEYKSLGAALRTAEEQRVWPAAILAARLLTLTGWRSSEVLNLTWAEIDLGRRIAALLDTKTGKSIRPLSNAVCDLLRCLQPHGGAAP
jgi:hypothetical protein